MTKYLRVDMPDGSKWDVPLEVIASDRATYYAREYNETLSDDERNDIEEVLDWASNNMDWPEVADRATKVSEAAAPDYNEGWINGHKEVVER